MSAPILQHPVHTLDNDVLLPADTVLTEEVLAAVIASNRAASDDASPLLQFGSVRLDLLSFLDVPPYRTIFADSEDVAEVFAVMEDVRVVAPILQSLDYFKEADFYTYRHVLVVFALSTLIARELLTDFQELVREAAAGPAHDFGKICVPLEILKKTDPLTRTERNIVEHHALAGYVLLSHYLGDPHGLAVRVARDHHERRDGSGYPRGIRLTDRLVEIVAVSDIYDALISPRPYRPICYDNRTALEQITEMARRHQIGWQVVKALLIHNRKPKPRMSECKVSHERRGTPPPGNVYGIIAEDTDGNPGDGDD